MPQLVFNPIGPPFDLVGDSTGGGGGSSGVLQQVNFSSAALVTTDTQLAVDLSTLPDQTDGAEWGTLAITPSIDSSTLWIQGNIQVSFANTDEAAVAIFANSDTSPIGIYYQQAASQVSFINFALAYTVSSTDPITFHFRYGGINNAGSPIVVINGTIDPAQIGDGATFSSVSITEITSGSTPPFDITITGNDNDPQSSDAFTIKGINGFQFNWNGSDGEFDIVPPNTFTHSATTISGDTAVLQPGFSHILIDINPVTVTMPANSDVVVGDVVEVIGLSGPFTIDQQADQQIAIGSMQSTLGDAGSVDSIGNVRSSINLRLVSVAGGTYYWAATYPPQGNFEVS